MENNKLPTKWLKFCIYWRLPIGMLVNAASLNTLIDNFSPNNLYSIIFEIFYGITFLLFPLITFAYSSRYQKKGYYLLYAHFIVEALFNSIFSALNNLSTFGNFIINLLIASSMYAFLWVVPNVIYLKKRKKLFNNDVSTQQTKQKENEPTTITKQEEKIKVKKKKEINYNAILITLTSLLVAVLLFIGIYSLVDYINSLKRQITSSQNSYNRIKSNYEKLQSEYSDKKMEYLKKDVKLNFYDEHIVFVLDGYGNYYYTYDQMKQVTQGKKYSFWAYTDVAAKSRGYQPFSN